MKTSLQATPRAARSSRGAWLALALALGLSACKKPADANKNAVAEDRAGSAPVATKFTKVVEQKMPPRFEVTGTLDPNERSEVASQTSGTVLAIHVDMGTIVKKGDVLVDLDSREASMRLDVANATAASQRARLGLKGSGKFDPDSVADVKMAKEGAALANIDFERTKQLYEQGAVSKAQFDAAKSAKERADAAYDASKNGVEQAWVALIASQSQAGLSSKSLEDTKVRAPFDGVIEARRISPGEYASPGRVIAVLTSDSVLRFKFEVPEAQSGLIAVGGAIEVRVAAHPDKIFNGEIKRLGASIKSATRTLPVEAEVPNADRLLKPGFFARGTVQLAGELVPVMLVPKAALLPATGGSRVFVKNGDKVEERLLATGATRGDLVEVTGKLSAGDEIAIENVSALSDGVAIAK